MPDSSLRTNVGHPWQLPIFGYGNDVADIVKDLDRALSHVLSLEEDEDAA